MGRSKDLATGTFTTALDVQGAITSDGLTVDTSDQVIINHSGDAGGLRIDSTNNTNTGSIRFGDVADNYIGAVEYNHTSDALSFYANNATRMTIDSSGHVTTSNQPIISGTIGTALTHPTGDQLVSFNSFFVSRGITFNSSTKRFTVPTAGVYSIMMTPFTYGGSGPHRVFIGVNTDAPLYATNRGHFYDNDTTSYASGALHGVVDLAANDYIVFRLHSGKLYNQSSDRFNEFSICKIA